MKIYPAIDIRGGKAVRLKQGRFDDMTVYNDDPVAIAKEFVRMGAGLIHVVDLDAAQKGLDVNGDVIARMVRETGAEIETGGGIRTAADIRKRLDAGVKRVIIGTMAVRDPEFVRSAIAEFGADRIVVGLDGRGGRAATDGWEKESSDDILSLSVMFAGMGVKTIIYTDISRDGMLTGPDIEYTERLVRETGIDIVASGGVGSPKDLADVEKTGAEGVIVGKAYYEGRIDLEKEIADRR